MAKTSDPKPATEPKFPPEYAPKIVGKRLTGFKFPENTPVHIKLDDISMSSPDNNRPNDAITQLLLHNGHSVKITGVPSDVMDMILEAEGGEA